MRWFCASLLLAACFREAPPCDQAGFDAVANSCVADSLTSDQCAERLELHENRCVDKVNAE